MNNGNNTGIACHNNSIPGILTFNLNPAIFKVLGSKVTRLQSGKVTR